MSNNEERNEQTTIEDARLAYLLLPLMCPLRIPSYAE